MTMTIQRRHDTVGNETCLMPPLLPTAIKNKQKREQVFQKAKKERRQAKLQRRLANAKREADDPKAKQVCTFSLS